MFGKKKKSCRPAGIALTIAGAFLLLALGKAIYNFNSKPAEYQPVRTDETAVCRVYYLLNIDGMKGLGHSALLLLAEDGSARIFSYNGMQYGLAENLAGKSGVGKMTCVELAPDSVSRFWTSGDIGSATDGDCDNFDRAICRDITREQYDAILANTRRYLETGDEFERLYAADREALKAFTAREDIPRYQIYTHNCDTVARELIAAACGEMAAYNARPALTPGGNFRKMRRSLGESWGIVVLGEDSLIEKLLADY